jgi:HK97 gp10 family phage protein
MSNIKISGLDSLLDMFDDAADVVELEKAVGKACALVERSAKQKAPKGSGDLRRSITSEVVIEGDQIVGTVFTPLEYAPYVEYGTGLFAEGGNGRQDVPWCYKDDEGEWHSTSGMKPHPYMRPALEENREKILRLLEGATE